MGYYTGMVAAVPAANRDDYVAHAAAAWKVFKTHGAVRMVDTWGVDVPHGKLTDFHRAVEAGEDEVVVFSWIEWPDGPFAEAAWPALMNDPAMAALPQAPFDGSRMIYGGFTPVWEQGGHTGAGYYQGFVLPVPAANKDAYAKMAEEVWPMFRDGGALGTVEGWGDYLPHGQRTDFHRAVRAEGDEVVMFSWIRWPDRATCEAAAAAMEASADPAQFTQMPFDGKRMFWGGFEPLFDSAAG